MNRLVRYGIRFLLALLSIYVVCFAAITIVLTFPSVQNKLLPYVEEVLSDALKAKVSVGHIQIALFDKIVLDDVEMRDRQGEIFVKTKELRLGMFKVPTVGWLSAQRVVKRIEVRTVELTDVQCQIYRSKRTGDWNVETLFSGEPSTEPDDSLPGPLIAIDVSCVRLTNTDFRLTDSTETAENLRVRPGQLNPLNMRFKGMNIEGGMELNEFKELKFNLDHLSGTEVNGGFPVEYISFHFAALNENSVPVPEIRLTDARIKLADSDLDFDFVMPNLRLSKLFGKAGNRRYIADFRPSRLDIGSINIFTPEHLPIAGVFPYLEGHIEGDYKRIKTNNLRFRYGDQTMVAATAKINDFTKPEQMFMDLRLSNSLIAAADVEKLLPAVKLPVEAHRIGHTTVDGKFTGFLKDFVANGAFQTPFGGITSNINLKFDKNGAGVAYNGELNTDNLNLDAILASKVSDKLNFSGNIKGQNFDFNTLTATTAFSIQNSNLVGYLIDSVGGALTIANRQIKGNLRLRDPEGRFVGNVDISLPQNEKPIFIADGRLSKIDLKHYGVFSTPYNISTHFNLNLKGDDLENIEGVVNLTKIRLRDQTKLDTLQIPNLTVKVEIPDTLNKKLTVESDLLSAEIDGYFPYINTGLLLADFVKETMLHFQTDSLTLVEYYQTRKQNLLRANFTYDINARNLNPVFAFFDLPLGLKNNTELAGFFHFNETSKVKIDLKTPTLLKISSAQLALETVDINLTKDLNDPDYQGDAKILASKVLIDSTFGFQNINLQPTLVGQTVSYDLSLDQFKLNNSYKLRGVTDFKFGGFYTELDTAYSEIRTGDRYWHFPKRNAVLYSYKTLIINNFDFIHGDQRISFDANIVPELSNSFDMKVTNLQLDLIKQFVKIEEPIAGLFNATVHIDSVLDHPIVQMDGLLSDFAFDSIEYGNLKLKSELLRRNDKNLLGVQAQFYRKLTEDYLLNLDGFYDPNDDISPMNFTLNSHKFPLELIQPLLKGVLYEISGQAYIDNMKITGTLTDPKFNGFARIAARFGVGYFQTKFAFDSVFDLDPTRISVTDMKLHNLTTEGREQVLENNYALIDGEIRHKAFQNLYFFFRIPEINNFQILSTAQKDNNAFYGTAVASSGFGSIVGGLDDLNIEIDATSGKGTNMNIPLTDYSEQQRLDYVYFKGSKQDSVKAANRLKNDNLGLNLNLNIHANENADIHIIFDDKTGDMISAKGEGTIKMEIDKDGEFQMFGSYRVISGNYRFTFKNLINKYFLIDKGGSISWNGSPYDAMMDLRAIYRVDNANMAAWDTAAKSARMDVVMNLKGMLSAPQIGFDLEMPSVNQSSSFTVSSNLNQVRSDANELSRQVFSLMMLRSVAPFGRFFGQDAGQAAASASVSEFLSAQLNSWISKSLAQDIGVSFSVNQDVVMMQLKANLLNDRITIERNGAIIGSQSSDLTLGNINISVKLLPAKKNPAANSGVLAAEIFNRENQSSGTVISTNRGVGIYYKREFDTLADLFKHRKPRKKKSALPPPPPPPTDDGNKKEEE